MKKISKILAIVLFVTIASFVFAEHVCNQPPEFYKLTISGNPSSFEGNVTLEYWPTPVNCPNYPPCYNDTCHITRYIEVYANSRFVQGIRKDSPYVIDLGEPDHITAEGPLGAIMDSPKSVEVNVLSPKD